MRTPSGRHARITKFVEGFVHFSYYDAEGGEGHFHSNLLLACDYIPGPSTHITADPPGPSPITQHRDPFDLIGRRTMPKL